MSAEKIEISNKIEPRILQWIIKMCERLSKTDGY